MCTADLPSSLMVVGRMHLAHSLARLGGATDCLCGTPAIVAKMGTLESDAKLRMLEAFLPERCSYGVSGRQTWRKRSLGLWYAVMTDPRNTLKSVGQGLVRERVSEVAALIEGFGKGPG
jgi:hypothetical protein